MTSVEARLALLVAEGTSDWGAVRNHARRAASLDPAEGAPQAALVALALDHAYQAFEALLLRVTRGLDLPVPGDVDWHTRLLDQAGLDVPGVRPALFPAEAARHWHALLRFRRFLRRAAAAELEAELLARNIDALRRAVAATEGTIRALLGALGPDAESAAST